MAKRKRRGLGSSAAEHGKQISRLRTVADAEAKNGLDFLRHGKCPEAIRAITRATFAAGRADTHALSSGHGMQAYSIVENAVGKVIDRCRWHIDNR